MIRYSLAAAATALMLAGPALAQAPSTTVSPVSVDAAKKVDETSRVVCKRITQTGSRTPGKKVCRTAGEWAAEERLAKENLDDVTRRSLQGAPKM